MQSTFNTATQRPQCACLLASVNRNSQISDVLLILCVLKVGSWPAGALAPGEAEAALLKMSTLSEEGVMEVKQTACDRLLSSRVEMKMKVRRLSGMAPCT